MVESELKNNPKTYIYTYMNVNYDTQYDTQYDMCKDEIGLLQDWSQLQCISLKPHQTRSFSPCCYYYIYFK